MKRRGFTLVEVLVGLVVFGVVMGALFTAFCTMWNAQSLSIGLPESQQNAKQMAMTLASAIRGATYCQSTDSGCTLDAGIQNATATSCTVYSRNSSGTLVQTTYAVVNGNFQQTVGGTTTVLIPNATLALTYYTGPNSTTYNATSMTSFTPSATTAPDLIAVQIVATVAEGGGSTTYTTLTRLRNGP